MLGAEGGIGDVINAAKQFKSAQTDKEVQRQVNEAALNAALARYPDPELAKSFEAPIKLVFPQDLLERGLGAQNMAMLGLGDIVIPGIFIALLLRYDRSLNRKSDFYFYTTFLAYVAGLLTTIGVMHFYKHAQPALLYLVPACIGAPLFMGLVRGDLKTMFAYSDHPAEEEEVDQKKDK